MITCVLLLAGCLAAAIDAASLVTAPPTVRISDGAVEGVGDGTNVAAYLGIPFAQSPPERFSKPVDAKPWTEPLKATRLKPACMQQFSGTGAARNFTISLFGLPMQPESEDCLYINVWAPTGAPPKGGFPVLFWIYGGNLQFGTASMPLYNGSHLASRGVILAAANYRTNVFGFPNSPDLPRGEGNPGFLDQRKALSWVQKNIHAFGGDPQKVTIVGESAGGFSVKQLVALPPPSPLPFRAAIMESQAMGLTSEKSWEKLGTALGCSGASTLSCIRQAPALKIKDIIEKQEIQYAPIKDDVTCSKSISDTITSGKAAKVPFVIGTNAEDGSAFGVILTGGIPTKEAAATGKGITSLIFQCPAAALASLAAGDGYPAVYRYYLNSSFPQYFPFPEAGAYHTNEIEYVFGTYEKSRKELTRLGNVFQNYWTSFTKDPAAPLAGWPKLERGSNQPVLVIGNNVDHIANASVVDLPCPAMAAAVAAAGL